MKKLTLLFAIVFGFAFSVLADTVEIRNTTENTIYARVFFNDGSDCVADNYVTLCIPPYGVAYLDELLVPYSINVATGCGITDWSTSSWRHNPFMGCEDAPVFSETPYIIDWIRPGPVTDWLILISL